MTKVQLGKLVAIPAVLGLVFFIVIPFIRGGSSGGFSGLIPLNTQMQAALGEQRGGKGATASPSAAHKAGETSPKEAAALNSEVSGTPAASPADALPPKETSPLPALAASASPANSAQPSPSSARPSTMLDLNTATLEQLDSLPGIGASKAEAILDYRNLKGRFKRLEELKEVKGIGDKVFEKLKPFLYVLGS